VNRFVFPGGTAVVTGAASGIGAALTLELAEKGSDLVLLDRDATGLESVVAQVRDRSPRTSVSTHVVDLADPVATVDVGGAIRRDHRRIRLLVNNAGVGLDGRFDQVSLADIDWLVEINFLAMVRLTHTLLPALKAERGSHLVNLSSVFGIIAPAGAVPYAASKFAVRGFTEALRHELAGDGIGVTCVHPGGVRTRIDQAARVGAGVTVAERAQHTAQAARVLTMEPVAVATAILTGVERRRGRVLVGWWSSKLPALLVRLMPVSYGKVVALATRERGPESG
jgi:short-subunit dehydrogenase